MKRRTAALWALHALAVVVVALLASRGDARAGVSRSVSIARAAAAHDVALVSTPAVRAERSSFSPPPCVGPSARVAPSVAEAVVTSTGAPFVSTPRRVRDADLSVVSARGPPPAV